MAFFRFRGPAILLVVLAGCGTGQGPSSSGPSASSGSASGSGAEGSGSGSGAGGGSGSSASGASGGSGSGDRGGSGNSQPASGSADPGGADAGDAGTGGPGCAASQMYPQTSFVNLAVTPGAALDPNENDTIPDGGAAPAAWHFYGKDGALCRDGSPAGFYVHFASPASSKLFIYLEGGGACSSATFCSHNPANIATTFSGGAQTQGQTVAGSLVFSTTPQEPYVATPASGGTAAYSPGIFDFTNAANPFKDWSGVYVPYCTGDVHFGTADNVTIPSDGLLPALTNQHFVGHLNLKKFVARLVPTFPSLTQLVLTGASAGGFAVGFNYGMIRDSFGPNIPIVALDDSGPPFSSQYLAPCLQKNWRKIWGFDAALPSDCAECAEADGSGLSNVWYYWFHKYAKGNVGLVSTMQDEVIRLFFAQGDSNCASDNATALELAQAAGGYTGMQYTDGLNDFRTTFQCTGRLATYYIGGQNPSYMNPTDHQHIFRDEFYKAITNDGGVTMAQWTADLLAGKPELLGP
jgi:hypothetical protein